ncbi:TonB-dependent receptor [Emticicia sp. 17c]|uniref:TonB-dependent receptor n=1 Tax=Emticicia sp. 17c TaxID=3127704 RepID=UPI00301C3B0B
MESIKLYFVFLLLLITSTGFGQNTGNIYGKVVDKNTQEALIGATISVEQSTQGTTTDLEGNFRLTLPVGTYNLKVTFVGYQTLIKYNINLTSGNAQSVNFELQAETASLSEVTVKNKREKSAIASDVITPLSVQSLTVEEIRSNPGGNFDVSKVIQALPGVAGTTGTGGFRNDIVLRGGGPNENIYYLDGIEIPVLNHFSTQGSAGGPAGIINTAFVEDIKLSTSAFNAQYDNSLSGVFEINQKVGNSERLQSNVRLSATELAATFDGKISDKTNFLLSGRRSYLQFLFKLIDLPIRPNYWDFQTKITHKLGNKTTLNLIGLGAIDDFKFALPKDPTPENIYIFRNTSLINQWNYTAGASIKHLIDKGFINIALSRNHLNNSLERYEDNNNPSPQSQNLFSQSKEIENKLRAYLKKSQNGFTYSFGGVIQYVNYQNNFFQKIRNEVRDEKNNIIQPEIAYRFATDLSFWKYGAFAQAGKTFANQVSVSAGIRTDMNSFTNEGGNPLKTLSPRISVSVPFNDKVRLNAAWGSYYKIPIYTVLGFKDAQGNYANRNNKYINTIHYALGLEYLPKPDLRFTIEGFYKDYHNYPVTALNNISLANLGGDFGAIGNEAVRSVGKGNTYGIEFFAQQKLVKRNFLTLSYTFVRSKFSGQNTVLLPSAWDYRHLVSLIYGLKLNKQWELGVKYRFAGGSPYTPYDLASSQQNYLTLGQGILDYTRLNSVRLKAFNQIDVRIDKKWNYPRWTLDLFMDVQNVLAFKNESVPYFTFQRKADNSDFESTDGQPVKANGSNAIPVILDNLSGRPTPSIGFIIEF